MTPREFALYSDRQYSDSSFNFRPFDVDAPIRWTTAVDIDSGRVVYVPAAMVYVPYYCSPGEIQVSQPISTGLACHSSYERSVIGGLCEVIERDAFMLAWLQGISPPQVDKRTLSLECKDALDRFESTGREVVILNITRDSGIPTLLSVQIAGSPELPGIVVAAVAAPRASDAARKSLEELALTAHYMQTLQTSARCNREAVPVRESVMTQDDHLRFWCFHENKHWAEFLWVRKLHCRRHD